MTRVSAHRPPLLEGSPHQAPRFQPRPPDTSRNHLRDAPIRAHRTEPQTLPLSGESTARPACELQGTCWSRQPVAAGALQDASRPTRPGLCCQAPLSEGDTPPKRQVPDASPQPSPGPWPGHLLFTSSPAFRGAFLPGCQICPAHATRAPGPLSAPGLQMLLWDPRGDNSSVKSPV